MKRKLSLIVMVMFLLNIMPATVFTETLGLIAEAKAETTKILTREEVEKFEGKISAGYGISANIRENGGVYASEGNGRSKIISENRSVYVSVGDGHIAFLRPDGTVGGTGQNNVGQINFSSWSDIKLISAGMNHTVGLKNDGTVVATGWNASGQCNVENWSNIVSVSAGRDFTVGLKSDGTVIHTGYNGYSLKNVESWKNIVKVSAGYHHVIGLKSDGTVVTVGKNTDGQRDTDGWTDIVDVSAGGAHTVAIKKDGTAIAVGNNNKNQCDVEEWNNLVSIDAGDDHTIALTSDGVVLPIENNTNEATNTGNMKDISKIFAGGRNTVGKMNNGQVLGLGEYMSGLERLQHAIDIGVGDYHAIGLKENGTVVGIGRNNYGQINVENWSNIVEISVGPSHTVGLRDDGTVIAVGENYAGKCQVQDWSNIVKIVAGGDFTIGIKDDGSFVLAGRFDDMDKLSQWTDIKEIKAGVCHVVGLKNNGTVVAVGNNAPNEGALNVDEWSDIVDIAVGDWHTVGLKSDGTVVAVGQKSNYYSGELNVERWKDIIDIAAGQFHTLGLKKDGTVVSVGNGYQEGYYPEIRKVIRDDFFYVDKKIVKNGDTIRIDIAKSIFYDIKGSQIILNDKVYELNKLDDNKYYFEGNIQEDSGYINISLPEFIDIFNNSLSINNNVKVIPLQSITTNKTQATNGESVTITATFTKPVKNDFTVDLSGAINNKGITLKEVAGTNGTKFSSTFIVPSTTSIGDVDITIKNLTDNNGVFYNSYTEKNVFSKIAPVAPVTEIRVSQESYKIGDYLSVDVKFDRAIDSQNVLMDISGAIEASDIRPGKGGPDSAEFSFYINEGSTDGPINITIKNVKGIDDGMVYSKYTKENVCDVYAMSPTVTEFKASVTQAKLGDTVRFTATFNKPVENGFYLDFNGLNDFINVSMTEVEGSNKTQYYYDYIVKDTDLFEVNDITVRNIYDLAGNSGYYRKQESICMIDGQSPEVTSVEVASDTYEQGDIGIMFVTFNEAVKSNIVAKFLDGDNVIQEVELTEVQGSKGKEFEAYFVVESEYSCTVDLLIENVEDLLGNTININKKDIFKIIGDEKPIVYEREDINKDGVIDALDLALVGLSYNTTTMDNNWNINADVNNDGIVDIFDLVLVSKKM